METLDKIYATKIFIKNDKNLLLVLKQTKNEHGMSFWELSGGKIERGESIEEGIIREVQEETSLSIVNLKKIGAQQVRINNELWEEYLFVCSTNTENVLLNTEEHSEYKWLSIDEIVILQESAIQQYQIDFYKDFLLAP